MKDFLRKHPDAALIALALVFLAIVISYFTWGIGQVVTQVNRGLNGSTTDTGTVTFDIDGAKKLDLRGLVNQ